MANLWPGEDYTNPHPFLICDPTSTVSHGTEEPFPFHPKIGKVWSINNPTNDQVTPQPIVEEVEMETGQEQEPLPPLRLKVQLPSRASFLANGVHQFELVLQFGDKEEQVLMIDIHGPMMDLPIQTPSKSEIPILDNSYASTNSFPSSSPPPISNQGAEESLYDPSPPPRKKITAARRRKLKQSTTCQICHKKLANKQSAANHSFVHLSQEEKEAVKQGWKNKCYFCAKRFQTPSLLHQHLVVHTKEKPHPCDKCGKKFPHKSNLTTHQRLHSSDPATRRPFNCEECGKSFSQQWSLTTHVTTVHLRLKEFQCSECDEKFCHIANMSKHINSVHLGIRYPCRKPHCGKSFTDNGTLRQHEKKAH